MKHLNVIAFILVLSAALLSTHLRAEVITQSFYPEFGPSYNAQEEGETDGWTYFLLQHETGYESIYYGNASVSVQVNSWVEAEAYLTTPEKTGGVGWITFWYKGHSLNDYPQEYYYLNILTSENGEDFTLVETVTFPGDDNQTWFQYSKIVNDLDAKYVRIELPKAGYGSVWADIDEIVITDAVNDGSPAQLTLSASNSIVGEVGQTTLNSDAILVEGSDVTGTLSVVFEKGSESPFALTSTTIEGASITGSGLPLDVSFSPTVKNKSTDFLIVSGGNLPNLVFKMEGLGLERNITEGFNTNPGSTYTYGITNTFDYNGWYVDGGSIILGNSHMIFEGAGALNLGKELISPKKEGSIGAFSFEYRAVEINKIINFIILESSDGQTWTEIDALTASSPHFTQYVKQIENSEIQYIKIKIDGSLSGSYGLIIDAFSITEDSDALAAAIGNTTVFYPENNETSFTIPLVFTNITTDISLFMDESQFTLGATTLTPDQVNGNYLLQVTYNPEEGKKYAMDTLVISGGNLNFPVTIPVFAYSKSETLFIDFDGEWAGNSDLKYYITDGWTIIGGTKNNYNQGFNSIACLETQSNYYDGGNIISPPKSEGVGSVQFYAKKTWYDPTISLYVSEDGTNWGEPVQIFTGISDAYEKYSVTVNNATAKYVKIFANDNCFIENIIVTNNNVGIAQISLPSMPVFQTESGVLQKNALNFVFENVTSDVQVNFKSGAAFSSEITTIPVDEIDNEGVFPLMVKFQSETGTYFRDTLVFSGNDFPFPQTFPIQGYILQNTIYEDFEGENLSLDYNNSITSNGWSVSMGSISTGYGINNSSAISTSYSGGTQIISSPKSGGVGYVQFYAKKGSYGNPPSFDLYISENGTQWGSALESFEVSTETYSEFEYAVNNANAKYIKIETRNDMGYIDNITVTANGVAVAKVSLEEEPFFQAVAGDETIVPVKIKGENLTSDIQVSFKSGVAFSSAVTTINQDDINNTTYELPVKFQSETGTYLVDTLIISGGGLAASQAFPLKSYNLQELIYQDFNGNWIQGVSYDSYSIEGWEVVRGNRLTYGNNLYEGTASLELLGNNNTGNNSSLLSIPKAGGVGIISFYYKGNDYNNGKIRIQTYQTLSEEPEILLDSVIPMGTPYSLFEITVNDPDAKYVEILNLKSETETWSPNLYFDDIIVTANGKGIPSVTAIPWSVCLSAYEEGKDIQTFEININNLEQEISLSLSNGSDFVIDKTTVTSSGSVTTEMITVTYTPSIFNSADTLWIESAGLVKPVPVYLYGNILTGKLIQNFEQEPEKWSSSITVGDGGSGILDGWLINLGRKNVTWENPLEGSASLRLLSTTRGAGSITSPAKAGGVNKAAFYWRSQNGPSKYLIQTSVNGQNWISQDSIETGSDYETGYHTYEKVIADKNAKYFRIQGRKETVGWNEPKLFIDSIVIDGFPYLYLVGEIQETETSVVPKTISVRVGGLLNSNATITLGGDHAGNFTLDKTELTTEELTEGHVLIDVIFTGAEASGEYRTNIEIANTDLDADFVIPVIVKYTKPYLTLVNTIDAQITYEAPLDIPVDIEGFLNTAADISLETGTEFTLSKTSIEPEELTDVTTVAFTVTFNASKDGLYTDVIIISNEDIETVTIPLSVDFRGDGIEDVKGNISIYFSEKDILNVQGVPVGTSLAVANTQGQTLLILTVNSGNEQFNVDLPAGVYIVKIGNKVWKLIK
ncbi:MAG: hypothetical protein LBP83_04900 [Dysgonamonadaceae bacterium]|jgi:hypothetical protein|nr:hypothetical protein [Dysgonamonadaceae bacterium]